MTRPDNPFDQPDDADDDADDELTLRVPRVVAARALRRVHVEYSAPAGMLGFIGMLFLRLAVKCGVEGDVRSVEETADEITEMDFNDLPQNLRDSIVADMLARDSQRPPSED